MQLSYLVTMKVPTKKQQQIKNSFVNLTGLPDLAISSEATYIRHRSLTTPFEINKDDSSLLEYYPTTFIYQGDR
jgi:hypothetical protein